MTMLTDSKDYAVMTHEFASFFVHTLGAELCKASQYRPQIKTAIDFLFLGDLSLGKGPTGSDYHGLMAFLSPDCFLLMGA
jgi:hypothetical protein